MLADLRETENSCLAGGFSQAEGLAKQVWNSGRRVIMKSLHIHPVCPLSNHVQIGSVGPPVKNLVSRNWWKEVVGLLTADGRGGEKRLSVSHDRVRCRLCSRCDRPPRKYSEKWSGNPSLWAPPEWPPSESHTWELCLLGSAPTVRTGLLPCNSAHWKLEKRKRELILLLDWCSSLLFIIKGEEIGKTDCAGGVLWTACSCLRAIDIFGDPRKPGRAGHLTRCPGSMGPSGTREVQATREQFAVFNWLKSAGLR